MLAALTLLSAIAWFTNFAVKQIALRFALCQLPSDSSTPAPIAARLAKVVPALIISSGISVVPHLPRTAATVVSNVVAT